MTSDGVHQLLDLRHGLVAVVRRRQALAKWLACRCGDRLTSWTADQQPAGLCGVGEACTRCHGDGPRQRRLHGSTCLRPRVRAGRRAALPPSRSPAVAGGSCPPPPPSPPPAVPINHMTPLNAGTDRDCCTNCIQHFTGKRLLLPTVSGLLCVASTGLVTGACTHLAVPRAGKAALPKGA